ncbi:hypothetical protein MBANPS3_001709 [Mucor bainieri]
MTTPNFNFQELHDFLFEPSTTAVKIDSSSSSAAKQFDFEQVWTGLNEACELILEYNALVNAIEKSSALSASDNIHQQSNSLSTFIGDLTPAAAAVVAAESPMMNTPFLDHSCMNTPFTPASVFTPSLAHMQNSPYYSPYINNNTNQSFGNINTIDNQDDVQVASYLKNDMSWQDNSNATPAISTADLFAPTPNINSTDISPELLNTLDTFNGDPSQLLLNNMNDNVQATAATSTHDEPSDFLFPPLPSDNQDVSYSYNTNPTQDLDASNLFDDCFDDCFFDDVNVVPEVVANQQPVVEHEVNASKKRKNNDSITNKNKRIKIASSNDQDQRKFECDICHATFNRRYNLGTHIKTHDKNRRKDFPCHLCQKFFDRKHDLTRHISTVHNGERAYACAECPSTFSRKDAMVRHRMQKHNVVA